MKRACTIFIITIFLISGTSFFTIAQRLVQKTLNVEGKNVVMKSDKSWQVITLFVFFNFLTRK